MIENLRTKLLAERRRNLVQEMEIRKEMGDAMLQQLMESEELRRWDDLVFVLRIGDLFIRTVVEKWVSCVCYFPGNVQSTDR